MYDWFKYQPGLCRTVAWLNRNVIKSDYMKWNMIVPKCNQEWLNETWMGHCEEDLNKH